MCGIVGIIAEQPVNQLMYDALTMLQHRGQDAAGIVTCDNKKLFLRKDNGLVRDVFHTRDMLRLKGNIGVGHVRYPTAGCESPEEAQPFYVNSPYGIALVHNGNLINVEKLRGIITDQDLRHLNTTSDSEVLLNILAHELQALQKVKINAEDVFAAIAKLHQRVKGAYSAIALITGFGMVAFRDPYGIRPLVYGKRELNGQTEYIFASESVALDATGFTLIDDVQPGEAIFVDLNGKLHKQQCADKTKHSPCLFEYVYLARPDSVIDKISVNKVRLNLGRQLAEKIKQQWPQHDINVVMPIPDTSRTAAHALALRLGINFREGFIKNRYITRTFIMPGQKERKKSVRRKLNTVNLEFKDKNVLLVDDSIVRGTTAKEIIQMARDAGAKKVYFASASPEICHPNVYGIDMPSAEELIAYNRSNDEICKILGADKLIYQDLSVLEHACKQGNPAIEQFENSVFSGKYITGGVDAEYLARIKALRNDAEKNKQRSDEGSDQILDLNSPA